VHTYLLTAVVMTAFAANSILCRMALGPSLIDPVSFTGLRLISGALMLLALQAWRQRGFYRQEIRPVPALSLFLYAICFSLAYTHLSAGTGALILFCLVQTTMILGGLVRGERPAMLAWIGLSIALAGLVFLLLPGVSVPPLTAALLMAVAGIAWGVYSLMGSTQKAGTNNPARDPVAATTGNFVGAALLAGLASILTGLPERFSGHGVALALVSGALASSLAYVLWYRVLPFLSPVKAASVQLSVPVIAAIAGILLLSEPMPPRLVISSIAILGGIALVIQGRQLK